MDIFLPCLTKHAILIANGVKTVEFKRSIWKDKVDNIILYASRQSKKVIAVISEFEIVKMPTYDLWRKYELQSGITRQDFDNYFITKHEGYGIIIKKIRKITPIDPHEKLIAFNVPQSFCYIETVEW